VPLRPIVNTTGSSTHRLAQHLARLLSGYTSHSPHHVKNCIEFVYVLSSLRVDISDIMVSFDIVSLFTRVPIKTVDLLGRHFLIHIQLAVLRANEWCSHGLTAFSCHSQFLHGGLREGGTCIGPSKTPLLVSLCR
jgi:hypothetical protein